MVDQSQVLLRRLPGRNRYSVVCASEWFDSLLANQTCKLLGHGLAQSYGSIQLEENFLPWVHLNSFNVSFEAIASSESYQALSVFNERLIYNQECKDNKAQTIVCASFECSNNLLARHAFNTKTGTPNDVQSMVQIQSIIFKNNQTSVRQCLAQLISPSWLLSSSSCLE